MLSWLDRYRNHVLALVALVLLAGVAVNELGDGEPSPIEFQSGSRVPDGSPIRVHVSGEVASPGVYDMSEGERVVDAVNRAGGVTAAGDSDAMNLARRLRDGEQVVVPARSGARSQSAAPVLAPGQLLNINTATQTELDGLPGIGDAYSRRIVDSRVVDGPFRSIDDLAERKVLPAATLEAIRPLITAGP